MKPKTIIIVGATLIFIGILLYFLLPLFLPYCAVSFEACINTTTGQKCPGPRPYFNLACADLYQNLALVLIVVGIIFVIVAKIIKWISWQKFLNFTKGQVVTLLILFTLAIVATAAFWLVDKSPKVSLREKCCQGCLAANMMVAVPPSANDSACPARSGGQWCDYPSWGVVGIPGLDFERCRPVITDECADYFKMNETTVAECDQYLSNQ